MASILSNVIILFMLAFISTLSSANEGWFRGRNSTFPFNPRHKRPRFPLPQSPWLPQPPRRHFPQPPSRQRPRSPPPSWRLSPPRPRQPRTPPPRRFPPLPPPSRRLSPPPPPSQQPRTPPPRRLPPLPPPSRRLSPPPPSRQPRTPPPPSRCPRTPPPLPSPPPPRPSPTPQSPRKTIVGGSEYWRLGFDYNNWALKNGPFYLNDVLVFKYDPPNSSTPPHNVYLLPNLQSFIKCDFGKAKMVANLTQGRGNGFNFVLKQQNPYYFACGEGNGFHCNSGSMKFSITPLSRRLPFPPPPPLSPSPPPPSRPPRIPPPRQVPPPPPPSPSQPSPSPSQPPPPTPQSPRKLIVGGSERWRLGFDYNDWALKNGPFYLSDILVFKYDPPNSSTPPHNVYLLPNLQSFIKCDFGKAKMVANLTQGSGKGFNFVLKQQNPYYFACGEGNGFHCNSGSMKFSITPLSRSLPFPPPPLLSPSPPPPLRQPQIPPPPPPPLSPSPSLSPPPSPTPQSPRKIIVGGSEIWRLGFDYNDWMLKNGPFYLNDILVFKYDRPNRSTPSHSVYLLPNMQSFVDCDFGTAKMVANLTQGTGDGFEFVLNQQNPYYFACGEANGFHCKLGSMKFSVTPIAQG